MLRECQKHKGQFFDAPSDTCPACDLEKEKRALAGRVVDDLKGVPHAMKELGKLLLQGSDDDEN